ETCFQRSLELAPDLLASHEALFHYHQRRGQPAKAEKAARRLLDRFPEHAPTLEALADLFMQKGTYDGALGLFDRAARANPLQRRLRGKLASAHLSGAGAHAEDGRFDEARADYQASLAYRDGGETYPALCKWAACEFKAGDAARAEELLAKALAEAGTRLAIAYNMVIEAIRLKLPRALQTRFDQEFNAALAEPPTAAGALAVLTTTAAHQLAGVTYHGQKTHEKKVLGYVDRARSAEFPEAALERVCQSLLDLRTVRHLRRYTELGRRRFPQSPIFPLLE